jgi:hypothetical protein
MPFDGSDKIFKTPEDLENKFAEYIGWCKAQTKFPTILGFCIYSNINRDTFYNYKKYDEYDSTVKKIEAVLEDSATQSMIEARNPAAQMFYLKNKFGWADKQEVTNNLTVNTDFSQLSDAELEKKLAELGYTKNHNMLNP